MDIEQLFRLLAALQSGDAEIIDLGDEEVRGKLREEAILHTFNEVEAVERLSETRIEPGSYFLGVLMEKFGIKCLIDPEARETVMWGVERIRELYAERNS